MIRNVCRMRVVRVQIMIPTEEGTGCTIGHAWEILVSTKVKQVEEFD